jgi:hypothetical protein
VNRTLDRRRVLALLLVVPALTASCAGTPRNPPAVAPDPSGAASDAPGLPSGSTTDVSPTPTPSLAIDPTPVVDGPPAAAMAAEGGDPVAGELGSFTWGDGGSDSPWLPGAPISVGAREPLAVTLTPAAPVSDWTARMARAGTSLPIGPVALGGGTGPIRFDAPPAGDWTVEVSVRFADELGSATYAWRLEAR